MRPHLGSAWRSSIAGCLMLLRAGVAAAQSGGTLTPDQLTYVVNKDLAGERWTITLNLASVSPQRFLSVTGNVFRPGGGAPGFVWCQVRDDSTGTLGDPSSVFRLRCNGTDACDGTATGCASADWQTIADVVEIPADFFLPPGGDGAAAAPAAVHALRVPDEVAGGGSGRGATLSPDSSNFLVNKDVGSDRWSISLNLVPAQVADSAVASQQEDVERGLLQNRRLSVTGNVFPPGGGEPSFVFCQERQDSVGNLSDPSSELRFSCLGTGRCQGSATDCARSAWQPIPGADDVRLTASFFLPPGGLPAQPASDSDIVVIGRTSDPPSIAVGAVQGFAIGAGATGACAGACTVAIGDCATVTGRRVARPDGCLCVVDDVPAECITCGSGASGSCGGDCSYPAGGSVVRGRCLPLASSSTECACYAADQSGVPVGQCGGALDVLCPQDKCCADDLRDGCDPARGDENCAGICVVSEGCDPTQTTCGICLDQRGAEPGACGSGTVLPGEDCCVAGGGCRDGSSFCFCEAGSLCVSDGQSDLCCAANQPKLCPDKGCVPVDAACCGQRKFCAIGSVCTSNPEKCCPANLPQLCADNIECAPDGATCCGGGKFCDAGFACTDVPGACCPVATPDLCPNRTDCVPAGSVCCGDGRFCPAGTVCEPFSGGVNCVPALTSGAGDAAVTTSSAAAPVDGAKASGSAASAGDTQ